MAEKSGNTTADTLEATDSKYVRTRMRILDAAAHVLSVKGYAGTRLSDVAKHADIQAPAIYYYFTSRDHLIEEVMASGLAGLRQHVQQALDALPPDTSYLDRIMTAVEAHLRHELEISDYATASIRNTGQIPAQLRVRPQNEAKGYGDIWRQLFDDAAASGELDPRLDPPMARMLVLGALNWAAEWWDPRRGSMTTIVETAQELIRNGLSAPDLSR